LFDVEFQFLALGETLGVGFLGRGNGGVRPGQFGVRVVDAPGHALEVPAKSCDRLVKPLKLHKLRDSMMHLA
jgi:hypothetical protein